MILDAFIFAAVLTITVSAVTLWSNPKRAVNRIFFTLSVHVALWLTLMHMTLSGESGLFWLRITNAVAAFVPFHLWMVKEIIVGKQGIYRTFSLGFTRLLATLALAGLVFTPWYIPSGSSQSHHLRGPGYYLYSVVILIYISFLSRETIVEARRQVGVRRAELQTFLLGGSAVILTVVISTAVGRIFDLPSLIHLQPLIVSAFYTATVAAVTTHRIFDARQLILLGLQKFLLVAVIAAEGWAVNMALQMVIPAAIALFLATAIALWTASEANSRLNRVFEFFPEATKAREAAFEAARNELRTPRLTSRFVTILKGWGQTDQALLMFGNPGTWQGVWQNSTEYDRAIEALSSIRWATPERLGRDRATVEGKLIGEFLTAHHLGLAVLVNGPNLSVLVGVGISASRRPYTYPQITLLLELAAIFQGAYERASLSAKAQHAEQLATVGLLGASLAHEIRNPLVSIKTFVQLLPTRYQDAAFREKFFRLMSDEVNRIDRLTEELLELASPHAYSAEVTHLHAILRGSLELVAPKASDKGVRIDTDFQAAPDQAYTDPAAVKQVLLNLCINAINAVEHQTTERWIKISTKNEPDKVELAVSDNGPGIAPEMLTRLFQPFQSTKSSGFGLGLAICRDILTSLNADIHVDPPSPGRGATFRVSFPCRPLFS